MAITREIRDEIKAPITSSINSFLKNCDFIKDLVQKVTDGVVKTISVRITQLEEKVEEIVLDNSTVVTVVRELKNETKNEFILQKYDDLEQQAKINNLRIYRINKTPNENLPQVIIQLFHTRLGIKVGTEDIVTCTRIGKRQHDNCPRGVFIKFLSTSMRQNIFKNKKMLKGSGIVVKKDLTDNRLKLMQAAVQKTSLKGVWSYNGTIYVMKDNRRTPSKNKDHLMIIQCMYFLLACFSSFF
nr:unnamed protein product [Callosobruchus analis]CAI5865981.1 unnamed protein product [Callosobruchus analis]